jgi:type IV pilus assembly protein PilW
MKVKFRRSEKGFTLMELLIAMALGLVVVGAAVQVFSRGMDATYLVSQRAEMQQDVRAAQNILVKDISLAGAGLPPGGVALAAGATKKPIYGCDQNKCYVGGSPATGIAFPGGSSPYMYWLNPGWRLGPVVNPSQPATDIISIVQADTAFPWADYVVSLNSTSVTGTVTLVASPPLPVKKLSDPAYGLKTGDLVLLTGKLSGNAVSAVGEVTGNVTGTAPPYSVSFAATDALGFNQSGATSNALVQMKNLTNVTMTRIWLITYFIGTNTGTPTLYRQVNGQTPAPVAENIVNFAFDYDTYDDNGNRIKYSSPPSPNLIRKINLLHLTARSPMTGVNGYQTMDVQTSVSARNMSFKNSYQ